VILFDCADQSFDVGAEVASLHLILQVGDGLAGWVHRAFDPFIIDDERFETNAEA
jgi:hypothetical protein